MKALIFVFCCGCYVEVCSGTGPLITKEITPCWNKFINASERPPILNLLNLVCRLQSILQIRQWETCEFPFEHLVECGSAVGLTRLAAQSSIRLQLDSLMDGRKGVIDNKDIQHQYWPKNMGILDKLDIISPTGSGFAVGAAVYYMVVIYKKPELNLHPQNHSLIWFAA